MGDVLLLVVPNDELQLVDAGAFETGNRDEGDEEPRANGEGEEDPFPGGAGRGVRWEQGRDGENTGSVAMLRVYDCHS